MKAEQLQEFPKAAGSQVGRGLTSSSHCCREVRLQGEAPPPQGRGSGRRSEGVLSHSAAPSVGEKGRIGQAINDGDGGLVLRETKTPRIEGDRT